jgi:N-acetylglucosaminyldiphosphoundecaprenol N-acetyl-beta-D-mannosaminyltransferase
MTGCEMGSEHRPPRRSSRSTGEDGIAEDVCIFDVLVSDFSQFDLVQRVMNLAEAPPIGKKKVYNANLHALNIAYVCPRFRNSLQEADVTFCDSFGVLLASRLLGTSLNHRNTPPDWLDDLAAMARDRHLSLYFLGNEEGDAKKAAELMIAKHEGLVISGAEHGFFEKHGPENDLVIDRINRASPNILIVGMGMPLQEFWIDENAERLNVGVFIPVGAALRYYAGLEWRAPKVVTDHGFEWLARLLTHPVRLFRRYMFGNFLFFWRLARWRLTGFKPQESCCCERFAGCSLDCEYFKRKVT